MKIENFITDIGIIIHLIRQLVLIYIYVHKNNRWYEQTFCNA